MKKQIIAAFVVVLFCGIFLFSCAEPEETDGAPPITGPLAELQGTWSTQCYGAGEQETLVVSGTSLSMTTTYYNTNSCNTAKYKIKKTYSNLTIGEKLTFSDRTSAYRATYIAQSEEHTPLSASETINFNTLKRCGFTNWVEGSPKDIIGGTTTCSSDLIMKNATWFNLYNIVGTNLYLGSEGSVIHPTIVNNTLSSDLYVKQ